MVPAGVRNLSPSRNWPILPTLLKRILGTDSTVLRDSILVAYADPLLQYQLKRFTHRSQDGCAMGCAQIFSGYDSSRAHGEPARRSPAPHLRDGRATSPDPGSGRRRQRRSRGSDARTYRTHRSGGRDRRVTESATKPVRNAGTAVATGRVIDRRPGGRSSPSLTSVCADDRRTWRGRSPIRVDSGFRPSSIGC